MAVRSDLQCNIGNKKITIRTMSDCTGAGAVERALESMQHTLADSQIADLELVQVSGSEAPDATHCHYYIEENFKHKVLWKDMVARTTSMLEGSTHAPAIFVRDEDTNDAQWNSSAHIHVEPNVLDVYSVGFECQDLSSRNTSGKALDLRHRPEHYLKGPLQDVGRSQKTLMSSLVTIHQLQPRVVLMENVGGRSR